VMSAHMIDVRKNRGRISPEAMLKGFD